MKKDFFKISSKKFNSRLIVGTGKYKNFLECSKAIEASVAEIVTVAVRRVNISDKKKPVLMDYINPKKIIYLPNTAGCFTSNDALRTLRLARESIKSGGSACPAFNAANEIAVAEFLAGKIRFTDIVSLVEKVLEKNIEAGPKTIEDVILMDNDVRKYTESIVGA